MASYYRHTSTHSRNIPYSFICEHCLQNSGPLTAKISGAEAEYRSPWKKLSDEQNATLQETAHKFLVNQAHSDYVDATEKQVFSLSFKDSCPHCGKPQSWAVSGMKEDMIMNSVVILIVGAIIALGSYFFSIKSILLSGSIAVFSILLALGFYMYKSSKINKKIKLSVSASQKNLPSIDWAAAEDLIAEKMAAKK